MKNASILTATPETEKNIGTVVEKAAQLFGDKTALIVDHEDKQYSFREVNHKVNQYANALQSKGVKAGDHVAVMLPNGSAFPFTWLALAKIGCVMVPVNNRYKTFDLQYILTDSEATALVIFSEYASVFADIEAGKHGVDKLFIVGDNAPSDGIALEALAEKQATTFEIGDVTPDSVMNIQYTSGTTGFPKGGVTTHEYWMLIGAFATHLMQDDDYFLSLSPFYYMDPQWEMLAVMMAGATMVMASKISAANFARCIKKYPITWSWGGEDFLYLEQFKEDKDHSLKYMLVGGLAPDKHQELEERFHVKARDVYGMTEIGVGTMVPLENDQMVGSGSMGIPPAFRQMKVVDEAGNEVPTGESGELLVKGAGLFKGYYKRPEVNKEAFTDGYFHTGDIVRKDENGYFYFVSRKKDMIRRMSDNISALEVEFALESHPKIVEAAVVSVPDPVRSEEVKAYVMPAPGETPQTIPPEEIVAYCLEKIAKFKVPRYVEYVEEFPRTPSGKVAKHILVGKKEDLTEGCYDRFGQ